MWLWCLIVGHRHMRPTGPKMAVTCYRCGFESSGIIEVDMGTSDYWSVVKATVAALVTGVVVMWLLA